MQLLGVLLFSLSAVFAAQNVVPYLADAECNQEVVIAELDTARVYGACSTDNEDRILRLTIENLAADRGPLAAFAIGFCGTPVIGTTAPPDWTAEVATRATETTVYWKHPGWPQSSAGVHPRTRLAGFTVRLKPGWRRSSFFDALWTDTGSTTATTHDCLSQ